MTTVGSVTTRPAKRQVSQPRRRRSRRFWAGLALVVGLVAWLGSVGQGSSGGSLDPRSAAPQGTRALAVLLAQRQVTVTVSTSAAPLPGGTTVIPFPDQLTGPELGSLLTGSAGGSIVIIGADESELSSAALPALTLTTENDHLTDPGCPLPEALSAGNADLGGLLYRTTGPPAPLTAACYGDALGAPLLVLPSVGGTRVVLLGSGDFLTNSALGNAGNAALAVGLLDGARTLRWVMVPPDRPGIVLPPQASLVGLLPTRVHVAVGELGLAVLLLALARGRRLGPPVAEPLPVTVPARETVLGRARLYRAARSRGAAGRELRAASRPP
ncbi:MAG: DUF4350 domain-containing protein, partial [Mycobacteriales bacterium]